MNKEQWEYKNISFHTLKEENDMAFDCEKLNHEGEEGWELITVSGGAVTFKRRISSYKEEWRNE